MSYSRLALMSYSRRALLAFGITAAVLLSGCGAFHHPTGRPTGQRVNPAWLGTWYLVGSEDKSSKKPVELNVLRISDDRVRAQYGDALYDVYHVDLPVPNILEARLAGSLDKKPVPANQPRYSPIVTFLHNGDLHVRYIYTPPGLELKTPEAVRAYLDAALTQHTYFTEHMVFRRKPR